MDPLQQIIFIILKFVFHYYSRLADDTSDCCGAPHGSMLAAADAAGAPHGSAAAAGGGGLAAPGGDPEP